MHTFYACEFTCHRTRFERNSSLGYRNLVWKGKTKHTGRRIIRPQTVNYSSVSLTTDLPEAEQQSHHQNLPPLLQVSVFWPGPPRHQQTCPIFGQQPLLYLKAHHLHFDPSTNPQSQSHLGHYHCCCLSQLLCYHPGEVLPQPFPHYLFLRKNVDQRVFFQWNFSSVICKMRLIFPRINGSIASLPRRYNKLVLFRNIKAIHVGKSVCFQAFKCPLRELWSN